MRSFVADTLALVIFFTIVSGLNEYFVAGMSWDQVMTSRGIGAPLMVLTARPYGLWRGWLFAVLRPGTRLRTLVLDSFALLAFQVPIYVAIIVVSGAEGAGILWGTLGFAALMFLLGRPYGLWLEFVRRLFGLTTPGQKPMSLGG